MRSSVLKTYAKEVVHLRSQFSKRRITSVMGAGVSQSVGFPSWAELTHRLATAILKRLPPGLEHRAFPTITQSLYLAFRELVLAAHEEESTGFESTHHDRAKAERRLMAQWRTLVREQLYLGIEENPWHAIRSHPYLTALGSLLLGTEFCINYNFDDTIEQLFDNTSRANTTASASPVLYQSAWLPHQRFRNGATVIYHPNGFLPQDAHDKHTEKLVFSEEEFADQLIDSFNGLSTTLLHYFTRNTCLLIGLSLDDLNLRMLLRRSAALNPGNMHYIVHYVPSDRHLNDAERRTLADLYFDTYNLIALFLGDEDIAELARLITMDRDEFIRNATEFNVETKYVYYLTGVVGSGKTTCLEYLSNFNVYDEWTERRGKVLAKSFSALTPSEERAVDEWIDRQFFLKNSAIARETEGVYVIDRSPLDPLTYKDHSVRALRADAIDRNVRHSEAGYPLQKGVIIRLQADSEEIQVRLLGRKKARWSTEDIETLQGRETEVFEKMPTVNLPTTGRDIPSILRDILRVIYRCDYGIKLCDIDGRLNELLNERSQE